MSEIRERAQHLVLSWGRPQSEFKEAITDLLAELERVEKWKEAVIDACAVSWVLKKEHENNPKLAVNDLCVWCHSVALDPVVSSDAKALHGRIAELEAENGRLKALEDKIGSGWALVEYDKARIQAARECIEIIDKYPAFLFGTDAVGVKLNLSQSIKAHFGLGG